jgi:hypothetical protein
VGTAGQDGPPFQFQAGLYVAFGDDLRHHEREDMRLIDGAPG